MNHPEKKKQPYLYHLVSSSADAMGCKLMEAYLNHIFISHFKGREPLVAYFAARAYQEESGWLNGSFNPR